MRILIANSQQAMAGGVEKYLSGLLPALTAEGHEVAVAYEHEAAQNSEPLDAGVSLAGSWSLGQLGRKAVVGRLHVWKPDLVFVHGCRDLEWEQVLLSSYPCYLFVHDHQRTCPTGAKSFRKPSAAPCNRRGGAACLALHYPRRCGGLNPLVTLNQFRRWEQSRDNARRYAGVIVASRAIREELVQQGVRADRIRIIAPPSPDAELLHAAPVERPFTQQVIFVGRLNAVKGAELLIRAIPITAKALGRTLNLVVVGDGPERSKLEGLADRLKVAVQFTGWLESGERNNWVRNSDLLVVPSIWPEPYGLVGVEAAALGVPAAAFELGGVTEWLIPGVTGELASRTGLTPENLAAAMKRALADKGLHQALREGAWRRARLSSFAQHVKDLEQFWAKTAAGFGAGSEPSTAQSASPPAQGPLSRKRMVVDR
jgi:glycosyltransferase involved in cell wall biosynthesis